MQVLYGAVGENDSKIILRIQPLFSRGLHSCALLDLWSILRVNSFEELWPSESHFLIFIVINAKNFSRPEENAGTHIPGPTARVGQFLCFSQVTLTPPEFSFCFLALGNVSINETEGYLLGAKRNAPCHNGNVKAHTVLTLPNGLQLNSVSRNQPIPVLGSLSAQFLGHY